MAIDTWRDGGALEGFADEVGVGDCGFTHRVTKVPS